MTTATLAFPYDHALITFSRSLKNCSDASTLYQRFLSTVQALVPCQHALLYLFQEQKKQLLLVASCVSAANHADLVVQLHDEQSSSIHLQDVTSLVACAARCYNLLQHQSVQTTVDHTGSDGLAEMAIPLIAHRVLYAVLLLQRAEPFCSQEVHCIGDVCDIAVINIANMQLEQRNRCDQEQLRTILSTIAHELRSPLNTINGYLELMLAGAGGALNEQLRDFVQRARMGSEHLYAQLEDLLIIARADSDQLRLNREIVSLLPIVTDAVEELELTAADYGISIHMAIPERLPRLYADAVRIRQVVRNLVSNALRFTPSQGQVTIAVCVETVRQDGESDEAVSLLHLQVCDTGMGIPPEFHERIFERYFQVPHEYERRAGGQGLGLAVVKLIIELHAGTVKVESVPASGTCFTCTLPCLAS